jgi:hypothetical protein
MKFRSVLISLAVAVAVAVAVAGIGCSDRSSSPHGARRGAPATLSHKDRYEVTAADMAPYHALLKAHAQGEQRALRIKVDAARDRLWVLGLKHIYVYDITGKQLIRRVALPNWSVAGFVCPPDMALDRSGSAFLASNVESTLWRIDAEDFSIKAQDITLQAEGNRGIGFGALTFAGDGALYALTAHEGWLWRIDFAALRGNEVVLSERVLSACTLTASDQRTQGGLPSTVVLCVPAAQNNQRARQITITPDFTRGYVSTEVSTAVSTEKCSS